MTAVLNLPIYLAFPAAMALAAVSDLTTMTIPNRLSGALALVFPFAALAIGMPLGLVGMHLLAGFLMLALGIVLFSRGWIGGGDAKLAAAIGLWFGFGPTMLDFLVYAGLFGGALTLGIMMFRGWMLPAFALRHGWVMRLHDKSVGVPYGIALAAGAMMVYPATPFAALAAGLM